MTFEIVRISADEGVFPLRKFFFRPPGARYICTECHTIATLNQMGADCAGEMWSNWICPGCGFWHHEDGWIALDPPAVCCQLKAGPPLRGEPTS